MQEFQALRHLRGQFNIQRSLWQPTLFVSLQHNSILLQFVANVALTAEMGPRFYWEQQHGRGRFLGMLVWNLGSGQNKLILCITCLDPSFSVLVPWSMQIGCLQHDIAQEGKLRLPIKAWKNLGWSYLICRKSAMSIWAHLGRVNRISTTEGLVIPIYRFHIYHALLWFSIWMC